MSDPILAAPVAPRPTPYDISELARFPHDAQIVWPVILAALVVVAVLAWIVRRRRHARVYRLRSVFLGELQACMREHAGSGRALERSALLIRRYIALEFSLPPGAAPVELRAAVQATDPLGALIDLLPELEAHRFGGQLSASAEQLCESLRAAVDQVAGSAGRVRR